MFKSNQQIKDINIKKSFKDSFTNTNYKRPFIIEKFIKDLHSKKLKDMINNRSKDPLIKKRMKLKKIKIPYKMNNIAKDKNELNSRNKTPFLHLISNRPQFNFKLGKTKLSPKKKFNKQRSDLDLPIINRHKLKRQNQIEEAEKTTMTFFNENNDNSISNSKDEEKNQENLITSGMFNLKDIFKNKSRKITICSFMNKLPGNKSLNENYKILNDVKIMNEKYNLNLNLEHNKTNSTSKIFEGKKYNIYGKLNKLFQYYSSEANNAKYKNSKYTHSNYRNSSADFNSIENKKMSKYEQNDSGNNTIEIMKNTYEDDSNTFLTKLNNYNTTIKKENGFDISKLIKTRCSLSDNNRNNEQIILNDSNISIHCLLSKVQKNISLKKILYKYIDKTLYELEKDPMYRKVKEFEENTEKILKNEK